MTTTRVDITARDQTGGAFSSVDGKLAGLASSVGRLTGLLAGVGVGFSAIGATAAIKGVVDAQDALAKLSRNAGVGVEFMSGLSFAAEQAGVKSELAAKGLRTFSRIVSEAADGSAGAKSKLDALGLSLDDLKNLSPEQQFLKLSEAISGLGKQDQAVAITKLLGDRMASLTGLLNLGEAALSDYIAEGQKLNPVTQQNAEAAERFNDNLDRLSRSFDTIKIEAANSLLPTLDQIAQKMADASKESGFFAGALAGLKEVVDRFATSDPFLKVVEFSGPLGVILADRVRAQKAAAAAAAGEATETKKLAEEIGQLTTKTNAASVATRGLSASRKSAQSAADSFIASLKKEASQVGLNAVEIKRLQAAELGVSSAAEPLIRRIEELNDELEETKRVSSAASSDLSKIKSITESVATASEKYADTQAELNRLLATGNLGQDTYNRALEKARKEMIELENQGKQTFEKIDEFAIQAARNIQSGISDSIFDFFSDGLDGMVRAARFAVTRIAAEFVALRTSQALGLGALISSGGAAAASTGGGVSALNIASLGSGALNLVQGGFGLTGALGGGLQSLGGAIGSNSLFQFGAGVSGDLLAAGGAGSVAGGLGASLGSFAGPVAIAGIADIGLRQLFGDKKLGGTAGDVLSFVPVIGTLINGLFGRGAPKFQNEELVGSVSAGGFDGVLNQAFKEKGGAFRGDRVSNFIADTDSGNLLNQFGRLSESGNIPGALRDSATDPAVKRALEVGEFLDEAFGGIGDTLKATADKLGLSSEALNNFSAELDLVSEKGQTLSEAQIAEQIARISDEMIATLIPNLDELSKKGETSADTVNRLNAQFSVLESAAMLFGNTAEQAAEKVRALGLDGQSAFIDSLGGVANAAAEIQQFYDTVFTDAQKLEVTRNQILGVLQPLGVDFIPTLSQLYDAVASGNPELIQAALKIDGLVVEFNRLNESVDGIDLSGIDKIADSENLIATRRQTLIDVYRRESDALKTTIDRFRSLGAVLTDARDSLALSELSPLTPQQRMDEARRQFNVDRSAASIGDVDALNRLPESGRAFLQASQIFNASSAEFVSDFNFVKSVLDSAAKVADTEADIAVKQLVELDKTVSELVEINAGVQSLDDAIFELKEAVLQGFGNTSISDDIIRDFVNAQGRTVDQILNAAVKNGVSADQISKATGIGAADISKATGGLSVSGDQIRQFVQSNISDPFAIYSAAKDFGITLSRVSKESGIPLKDIEEWTRANNLPMFESGTNFVQKGGLAVLHRAEAVTPASHMADMAREISELRKELSELRREQNQQTGALINVAMQSQRENAQTIVAANKELAKNDGWRKQVGGGLR